MVAPEPFRRVFYRHTVVLKPLLFKCAFLDGGRKTKREPSVFRRRHVSIISKVLVPNGSQDHLRGTTIRRWTAGQCFIVPPRSYGLPARDAAGLPPARPRPPQRA